MLVALLDQIQDCYISDLGMLLLVEVTLDTFLKLILILKDSARTEQHQDLDSHTRYIKDHHSLDLKILPMAVGKLNLVPWPDSSPNGPPQADSIGNLNSNP